MISISVVDPAHGRAGWEFGTGPAPSPTPQRQAATRRNLSARRSALYRPRHRAGAVGQEAAHHRQQRVVRNHPHAQFGVRRVDRRSRPIIIRRSCAPRSIASTRASTTTSITASIAPASPPRRRPTRKAAARVFAALDWLEERAVAPALSCGRAADRGGLAAVHDARALRRGLLRPFQMQSAPHRRLSESVELSARPLSDAGRRRDRRTWTTSSGTIT